MRKKHRQFQTMLFLALLGSAASSAPPQRAPRASIAPAKMARVGTVDKRFQSFNVEMVEITGGRFWKPFAQQANAAPNTRKSSSNQPAGLDPSLFQYRPPIDLTNPRLRKLAAALGPACVRVSGTWANTTYFHDSDTPAPATPPAGFNGVLTRPQWKSVIDFSRAVDAQVVTSFAISPGTRDSGGLWTPAQARQILAYTKFVGGSIAAAEFMNEPTYAAMGGAPPRYDAAAYARDFTVFRAFAKEAAPGMVVLGPGSVGEGVSLAPPGMAPAMLKTEDLLAATGPAFDAFSYHFYGTASQRCAAMMPGMGTTATAALSDEWLSRTDKVFAFYAGMRDRFLPGKPLWITETAQAACGGDVWASTFLDSFRYLDQLGRLARQGVQVIAHNTLASSDYGLLDEDTLTPRPNYWAALLWRKLMGTAVLDPGSSPAPGLHLYAHCLRGIAGGVAVLAINTDRSAAASLDVPVGAERYTLTAQNLEDARVRLNGVELQLGTGDALPQLAGVSAASGSISFAPASITFLAIPNAGNGSCK